MSGWLMKIVPEVVALRVLAELRVGIGDGDEVLAGLVALDRLHAIVEVAMKHRRLGGRPRLRRDDEQRPRRDRAATSSACTAVGDGRVEHVQPRISARACRTARRVTSEHRLEPPMPRTTTSSKSPLTESANAISSGAAFVHLLGHGQPAEGVGDDLLVRVVVLPERRVFLPDALDELLFLDALRGLIDRRLCSCRGGADRRSPSPRIASSRRASIVVISDANDSSNDFTPSSVSLSVIALRLKPFSSNLRSTSRASSRSCSSVMRHAAVILERVVRRRRNGVDGVRPDQRLDVEHVAVLRILRAGRRPQRPLHARAVIAAASRNASPLKVCFEELIGELRVRDGDLAEERADLADRRSPSASLRSACRPARRCG